MDTTPPLASGSRLGNYILEAPIGRGAFAEVWKAHHHERPERVVAVKIATEPRFRKQLQREIRLPEFEHPNVVPILDSDTRFCESPYIVMPYLSGGNLTDLIRAHPNGLPEQRAKVLVANILSGLVEAHHRGIVHRDIKPSNILLDRNGCALIADFGLSTNVATTDLAKSMQQSTSVSTQGVPSVAGSYAYMAPEILDGTPPTPATDVYSLGVVLFEMVTGRRPHGVELPSLARPSLSNPAYWDGLFFWSCCRHPERYADAAALKAAADGNPRSTPLATSAWNPEVLPTPEEVPRSFIQVALGLSAFAVFALCCAFSAPALAIAIALVSSAAVHLLGSVFVALAAGLRIKEVQFAFGKPLFRFRLGILPLTVGYLPWGGSVKVDNESLERRSHALQFFLQTAGHIAVLCFSGIFIGYGRAASEFAAGFPQIVQGALAPLTVGEHLVSRFFDLVQSAPFGESIGVLITKVTAFNFLPFIPCSGANAMLSLVPGPSKSRALRVMILVTFPVGLALVAAWAVSVCSYVLHSL